VTMIIAALDSAEQPLIKARVALDIKTPKKNFYIRLGLIKLNRLSDMEIFSDLVSME
jgi:hypothetical protein